MTTLRGLPIVLLGLLAVGLVLAGLSVEAFTRSETHRAQRALRGALARTVAAEGVAPETLASLAESRRHVRKRRLASAAQQLEELIGEHPTPEMHGLVAAAYQAADQGMQAARHAQLAARLAPEDGPLQKKAEHAVNVALAYRARPWSRGLGGAGGLVLVLLAMRGLRRRRVRLHLQRFLDGVAGRVAFNVDGEPQGSTARLRADTEALTIDVFLKGRHGMACPPRPGRAPTMHVTLSHAGASRTVRLTPIKRMRDKAVRISVRQETLRRILDVPGRWRVHVRLGRHPLTTAVLEARTAQPPDLSRRNGALTAS